MPTCSRCPEFSCRLQVLRRMAYIDDGDTVQLKGRVACEINSADELLGNGNDLCGGPQRPHSRGSCGSAICPYISGQVGGGGRGAHSSPGGCHRAQPRAGLAGRGGAARVWPGYPSDEYARGALRCGLVDVVYFWAKGMPFKEICELTTVMEGIIVRTVVRLEETCREFRDAARVMGNIALFDLMKAASEAIKRDVVFAASLYVQ
eukprot:jgi/Botrbrau1/7043/Bobra.0165s0066.1